MDGMVETLGHLIKAFNGALDKFIVDEFYSIFFGIHVVLLDFKSLLKKACFQFDQVTVVPMEDGDFYFWMGNFSDDSHDVNIVQL